MAAAIVVLVLVLACLIGYMIWASTGAPPIEPPPTYDELLQARLDWLRIERKTDVALANMEVRQAAERTKQAIADALDDQR